jgi:phosphoribosylanthranilate isomerase
MIVQIYEVTTSAEARALGAMGVDHSAFWSAQLLTLKAEFPQISLMRSIPVVDESSIALARSYDGIADFLLLDSSKSGDRQIGALGVTHSWELDYRIIESVRIPVIIAGGLGPENAREAIRSARPAGVDSKTKTDKSDWSHTKDLQKVLRVRGDHP